MRKHMEVSFTSPFKNTGLTLTRRCEASAQTLCFHTQDKMCDSKLQRLNTDFSDAIYATF